MSLLAVRNLHALFNTPRGHVRAVDGISFEVAAAEAVGVVGESGCGKSVTGLSLMRLVPQPPGEVFSESLTFAGQQLFDLTEKEMRTVRGRKISMIFQEPMTSLNPVFTIGNQICEAIRLHQQISRSEALQQAFAMLKIVGIPQPELRLHSYPHELSGGMRQRVMIAIALACRPQLLIADEPTTALDVTIQAQILDLLKRLQQEFAMAILLISHNLGVIATLSTRVMVMYAGRVVEMAPTTSLLQQPLHPYTQGLYASLPSVCRSQGRRQLDAIPGSIPDPLKLPSGCKFRDRCALATTECSEKEPDLREIYPGHFARCIYAGQSS